MTFSFGNSITDGEEYGSARWGTEKDIAPFVDPVFENNVILTQTESLMMSSRPKEPKYARNKNVLVIGGSGSGKTRFYVKPNLMQMSENTSYVVTDPKGTILVEVGKMMVNGGYRIKVLNTINFKKSMHYNPFQYIRNERDILKLVNTIIANTKGEGEKSGEDFWVKAERLYYCALIGYIWYEAPEEEKNFSTLLAFVDSDDWIEADMYRILLTQMEHFDADVSIGGFTDDLEKDGSVTVTKVSDYGNTPFAESNTDTMRRFLRTSWAAWDKLCKAELFSGIRYPVGEINEDEAIALRLLSRCRRVCYTNEVFYHYIKRPGGGSITESEFSVKKLAWQRHCADNLRFVQEKYPELEADAAARYRGSLLWSLTEIALSDGDWSEQVRELRSALRKDHALFKAAPFTYSQDKIRLEVLTHLPFPVYRTLIRIKRRK